MGLLVAARLGSGALHAVTGPDHVLSLAPLAVAQERRLAWRIGLGWGLGHAVRTLLVGLVVGLVCGGSGRSRRSASG